MVTSRNRIPCPMTDPAPAAPTTARTKPPQALKLAIDFGPLAVFLVAYWAAGLFWATGVFMAATVAAIVVSWIFTRHVPVMLLVTGAIVLVFGGLTLWLHDETFFKMKPTIIYLLFAVVLLGGLAFGKSMLAHVFDFAFKMDAAGWRKLTLRWGLFFLVMAATNEFVWRNFAEQTWVYFKIFGFTAMTFLFAMSQVPLMQAHAVEEEEASPTA